MKHYTTYDPTTGEITGLLSLDGSLPLQPAIEGIFGRDEYRIVDNTPVSKPSKPGDDWLWDTYTLEWRLDHQEAEDRCRTQRNQLLSLIDRVNPLWYASLTAEQQTQLQQYRQALLDITDQPGFPTEVVWPVKPAWL